MYILINTLIYSKTNNTSLYVYSAYFLQIINALFSLCGSLGSGCKYFVFVYLLLLPRHIFGW